ncbi:MAG: CvpA family protein [Pseudomonadota bacterium]|nr:CvpA family protein [Pseudomonadota bacterium]
MESLPVNVFDLVIIAIVLVSAVLAFSRGFVHEILSVSGWVAAYFGAREIGPLIESTTGSFLESIPGAREFVEEYMAWDMVVTILALVIAFAVILAICAIITHFISRSIRSSALNAVDRSLGAAFGIARGALLVSLMWLLATWIWKTDEQPVWMKEARTRTLLASGADFLRELAPKGLEMEAADDREPAGTDSKPPEPAGGENGRTTEQLPDLTDPAPAVPGAPAAEAVR